MLNISKCELKRQFSFHFHEYEIYLKTVVKSFIFIEILVCNLVYAMLLFYHNWNDTNLCHFAQCIGGSVSELNLCRSMERMPSYARPPQCGAKSQYFCWQALIIPKFPNSKKKRATQTQMYAVYELCLSSNCCAFWFLYYHERRMSVRNNSKTAHIFIWEYLENWICFSACQWALGSLSS